jgi:PST family polysaccharide transporter
MVERITRGAIGVSFGILIARNLGPAAFGQMGFAQALTAITGIFALLGLETVVVREIVRQPHRVGEILGSAAFMRFAGALIGLMVAVLTIEILRPSESQTIMLVAVLAAGTVFQASDVIELYFQANASFQLNSTARICACLLNALLRVGLLLSGASVVAFVWSLVFEMVIGSLFLVFLYRQRGGRRWQISFDCLKKLSRDAWPLAASALVIMAYMRIDQLLLGQFLGSEKLGIYMAAVRLTEIWYVLPVALAAATFPHLVEARLQGGEAFSDAVYALYKTLGRLALLFSVGLALFSGPLINFLYGSDYAESAVVLQVYAWATIPVFLGTASERYLIVSGHTGIALTRTLLGFVVNISLNFILIPRFGVVGAAWATAAAYFVSVFSLIAWPAHRQQLQLMARALFFSAKTGVDHVAD